jgi:hypothetical protein
MDSYELNIVFVHPFFPARHIRYEMGVDTEGVLCESVQASIWKMNTDGSLQRVKYSDDIPSGHPKDDE